MRKVSLLPSLLLAFSVVMLIPAFGQVPPTAGKVDNEFVQQQFGREFTLLPELAPVFGDLDGDGVEDVVIAARCKNPLLDEAEHNYTVMDPYYDFYGYGDPRVTTTFKEPDPARRGLARTRCSRGDFASLLVARPRGSRQHRGCARFANSAAFTKPVRLRAASGRPVTDRIRRMVDR